MAKARGIRIVGVDCAVETKNVGVAVAEWNGERCRLLQVVPGIALGGEHLHVARWISSELSEEPRVLVALDAPLGWPAVLGKALSTHRAGDPIVLEPHRMFRRETDREVRERLGKQTLDVGADRIARTALAALSLLGYLREETGHDIRVATSGDHPDGWVAIEVYPAGTLRAYGLPHAAYKLPGQRAARERILAKLGNLLDVGGHEATLLEDADCLDAAVCVAASLDFLRGDAPPPKCTRLAAKEGWIWVRSAP